MNRPVGVRPATTTTSNTRAVPDELVRLQNPQVYTRAATELDASLRWCSAGCRIVGALRAYVRRTLLCLV